MGSHGGRPWSMGSQGGPLGTHWPLGTRALGDPLGLGDPLALGDLGPWGPLGLGDPGPWGPLGPQDRQGTLTRSTLDLIAQSDCNNDNNITDGPETYPEF